MRTAGRISRSATRCTVSLQEHACFIVHQQGRRLAGGRNLQHEASYGFAVAWLTDVIQGVEMLRRLKRTTVSWNELDLAGQAAGS